MTSIEKLYSIYKSYPTVFTDSRKARDGGIFFALKGDRFDGNNYALKAIEEGADYAVVDREDLKDESKCIWFPDTLKALQDLANYHRRQLKIPFLGITGTNGKTTTKELIAAVLNQKYKVLATQGNFNNHIGVPLTLLSIRPEHEFAVIEMGANHIGEIDFLCRIAEPDYGIITNVGKAHLEGFGSFEGVKQTKTELYRFIANKGKGIFLNADNEHLAPLVPKGLTVFTYACKNEKADLVGDLANKDLWVNAKILFDKGWLYLNSKLTGAFNLENILAASRIGVEFGVDPLKIKQGIEQYVPSNNRSQILKKGDTTFLIDCYNANPSSMEVSLTNFADVDGQNKVAILGDMLELGSDSKVEHQKVIDQLLRLKFEKCILVGKEFAKLTIPDEFSWYETVVDLKKDVSLSFLEGKFVLLKGSRGIRLEALLDWE